MQMLKFVSYKECNAVSVILSHEYNADIIPAPQKHSQLIEKIKAKGYKDNNLLSYGCCKIVKDTIIIVSNDYFYSYSQKCDDKIKTQIYIEWALKKIDQQIYIKELEKQMR